MLQNFDSKPGSIPNCPAYPGLWRLAGVIQGDLFSSPLVQNVCHVVFTQQNYEVTSLCLYEYRIDRVWKHTNLKNTLFAKKNSKKTILFSK